MIDVMSGHWIGDTLVRHNKMQRWNYCMMENKKGKGKYYSVRFQFYYIFLLIYFITSTVTLIPEHGHFVLNAFIR